MPFTSMSKKVWGEFPATQLSFVRNKVSEALAKIEDENDWHFQTMYAGWLAPGQLANTGTFNVTPYQNTVTADATATAAVYAIVNNPLVPPLTQLQYRDPARAVYSIIGLGGAPTVAYLQTLTPGAGQTPGTYTVNGVGGSGSGAVAQVVVGTNGQVSTNPVMLNPGTGYTSDNLPTFTLAAGGTPATFTAILNAVLTLDRPWMEPTSGPGQPYMIYQCYFVVPAPQNPITGQPTFRKFIEVRDTTNARPLDFWSMSQADLAVEDPQRTDFSDPRYVVAAGIDLRTGSATYGAPMFELWPQQLSQVPYPFSFEWLGPQLVNGTDIVPYPITEELVMTRAREMICLFKEAQKGENVERGAGANWPLLAQGYKKEYGELLDKARAIDVNLTNERVSHVWRSGYNAPYAPYANRQGGLNIGGFPSR